MLGCDPVCDPLRNDARFEALLEKHGAKFSAFLVAALALVQSAAAEWQLVSSDTERSRISGIEHNHIVLREAADDANATIDLALFSSKSAGLRLIDNPDGSDDLAAVMRREKFIAGVNGGYFDPGFKPIGLRISNGVTTSPLTRARLLTGVLCGSARATEILRLLEFPSGRKCDAAVECGPFLVDRGHRIANLDNSRRARRTFAAVAKGGNAALGVCSDETTLAQLGDVLGSLTLGQAKISRALNLDGGSSTAFWFQPAEGNPFLIGEWKTVRDFVAIAPR